MAVARINSWSALTTGSDPTGTVTVGAGANRMLVMYLLVEYSSDFTVSTFTVGGQAASYTDSVHIDDGTADQIIKVFIWNQAALVAMTGTSISYTDDGTMTKGSWAYATFKTVTQAAPTIVKDAQTGVDTLTLTTTSTSSDFLVGAITDKSANRAPLTYDTMTEQLAYSAANVSHGIADGLGGDASSAMKNDLVATSTMAAMVVILTEISSVSGDGRQNFIGGMTANLLGGMSG